ncbi:MAG: TIGR03619 family F420-dependent LLM class oxidoreductase [Chloroflexi bacterium]|nr:TIGR03619 family F420-dependent LLM class oxidoreductase [Chloroflexota bacterium]
MKFGIILPNYDRAASWDALRRAAILADELGYESIWTTDHLLVPKENINPYGPMYEALVTLALLAPLAPRVQLGTSILVLPMRNPVLAAKQAVTIDAATNGRMILGVGVGWNEKEYGNLSANFKNRGKRLDEHIQLLRALWSNHEVSFQGKYTQIADGYSAPLAVRGSIPIWIGGNDEPSWRRAAKFGDGWHSTGASPDQMAQGAQRIQELRPARPITISARLSIDFDPNTAPTFQYRGKTRYRLAGPPDAIRARAREYAQAGVQHLALTFPWEKGLDAALAQMQQFARELMPEL